MLKYKHYYRNYQFIENQKVMSKAIDPEGAGIYARVSSQKPVTASVVLTDTGEELILQEGKEFVVQTETIGFDEFKITGPQTNKYAVECQLTANVENEFNDGEQTVLEPQLDTDQRIDVAVQRQLIAQLMRAGFEEADVIDILEGVNTNDDDMDFDDMEMPSEAEMDDLIIQAQQNLQEDLEEDGEDAPPEPQNPENSDDSEPEDAGNSENK